MERSFPLHTFQELSHKNRPNKMPGIFVLQKVRQKAKCFLSRKSFLIHLIDKPFKFAQQNCKIVCLVIIVP